MVLVNLHSMLNQVMQRGYAVGAFNMVDINSMEAIIHSAVQLNSPVIVSVAEVHFPYVDIEKMSSVIGYLASRAPIPVALHLDHGRSGEAIMKAIRWGFTSVMYDGSQLPLAENIARTAEVVHFAHYAGVSVEAELGHVGAAAEQPDQEDETSLFTDPEEAAMFVRATGVDALAVAIGSAHGVYRRKPKLDFDRLQKIKELTNIPLVLHGGSGLSDEDLRKSIKHGICKINVYTELSQRANEVVRNALQENPDLPYPEIRSVARQGMAQVVAEKIRVFGSYNVFN